MWSQGAHRLQRDVGRHKGSAGGVLEDSFKWLIPWFESTCAHPLMEGNDVVILTPV